MNMHLIRLLVASALITILLSCNAIRQGPTGAPDSQDIVVDDSLIIMFTQALTHLQQHNYKEAITLLEALTDKEKRLAAPFVNLGIAYSRTGQTRKAEQNFITALRIDIGHPVANNELALLYRKSGKLGAARVAYQNALAQHPDYLPARRNLGILCEIYLHDLTCALEHYQAYIEYEPGNETVNRWAMEIKQRIMHGN